MFIAFPEVEGVVIEGMDAVSIPPMITVEETYDHQKIEDAASCIRERLDAGISHKERFCGKRIAVTVGSRGIPHLAEMVRAICEELKAWGALPFLVPSMGSHGGGTVSGQLEILRGYGITEEQMGVPILATLDVVQYGELENGIPLCCNRCAWEADGILLFNKVKPHTDFRGSHESGLAKMIAIGLGDHKGASVIHGAGVEQFPTLLPAAAERFIACRDLMIGIGVVQNAYDEICAIEAAEREHILELDRRLLALAKERIGKLKFDQCDILILDEIGKDVSGCGADPNVTGRPTDPGCRAFSEVLDTALVVVLGITPNTHHNACGIGLADVTTRDCLNEIDWGPTWTNHFNSLELRCAHIPCYANSDRDAILLALRNLPEERRKRVKLARIRNTLEVSLVQVSPALYEEMREREGVRAVSGPEELRFDASGRLISTLGGQGA